MEEISRTQKKKEALALQVLGERLVTLSSEQLKDIEMPQEVYEAVKSARTVTKHGARKRQMQYIGALMRKIDPEPIRNALEIIDLGEHQKAVVFKKVEKWRNDLIEGDKVLLEKILQQYPRAERQHLNQLIRNAKKEIAAKKSPKSSRMLFRYLRQICDWDRNS